MLWLSSLLNILKSEKYEFIKPVDDIQCFPTQSARVACQQLAVASYLLLLASAYNWPNTVIDSLSYAFKKLFTDDVAVWAVLCVV